MKTNFKKALIPFGVIVLGVVGAFASNVKNENNKLNTDVTHGYYYKASEPAGKRCVQVEVDCNNISGPICTDASLNVAWEFNGLLNCTGELYMN